MRINLIGREYPSAMQIAKIELESETRVIALRNDEEVAEMRWSVVGREMELMITRAFTGSLCWRSCYMNKGWSSTPMSLLHHALQATT